jgi:glycosidase
MRVHDDYKEGWNVAAQVDDPNSVFSFWQKLLKLRKEYEALVYGMSRIQAVTVKLICQEHSFP